MNEDILITLDRKYRDFVSRSYGRLPTVLILPDRNVEDYDRALSFMTRYVSPESAMHHDTRRDHTRHRDALVVVSRWVQEPEFAWTPERIGP